MDEAKRRAVQSHRTVVAVGRIFRHAGTAAWVLAVCATAGLLLIGAVATLDHGWSGAAGGAVLLAIGIAAPAVLAAFGWACRMTGRLLIDTADSIHELVVSTDATNAPDRVRRLRGALTWLRAVRAGGGSIPRTLSAVVGRSRSSALLLNPWFLGASVVAALVCFLQALLAPVIALVVYVAL